MKNHAFVVGIDAYNFPGGTLKQAVGDALSFASWLTKSAIVPPEQLTLVLGTTLDSPEVPIDLLWRVKPADEFMRPGGRSHLLQSLRGFRDSIDGKADRLIFYFAGHGLVSRNRALPGDVLCASDYSETIPSNSLMTDSIQRVFSSIPSKEQFFLYDACRSLSPNVNATFGTYDELELSAIPEPDQFILKATAVDTSALENPEGGTFTRQLLAGLDQGAGSAKEWDPSRGEYVVRWNRLCTFVEASVKASLPEGADKMAPKKYGGGDPSLNPELARFDADAIDDVSVTAKLLPPNPEKQVEFRYRFQTGIDDEISLFEDGRARVDLKPGAYIFRAHASDIQFSPQAHLMEVYDSQDDLEFIGQSSDPFALPAVEIGGILNRSDSASTIIKSASDLIKNMEYDVDIGSPVQRRAAPGGKFAFDDDGPGPGSPAIRYKDLPGSVADNMRELGNQSGDMQVAIDQIRNAPPLDWPDMIPALVDALPTPHFILTPDSQTKITCSSLAGGETMTGWGGLEIGRLSGMSRITATHSETGTTVKLISPDNVAGNMIYITPPAASNPPSEAAAAWINGRVEDGVLFASYDDAEFAIAGADLASVMHMANLASHNQTQKLDHQGMIKVTAIKEMEQAESAKAIRRFQSRLWKQRFKNAPVWKDFEPVDEAVPEIYRWDQTSNAGDYWHEYRDEDRKARSGFKQPIFVLEGHTTYVTVHERTDGKVFLYLYALPNGSHVDARVMRGIIHIQRARASGWNALDDPATQALLAGEWFEPVSAAIVGWLAIRSPEAASNDLQASLPALIARLQEDEVGMVDGDLLAARWAELADDQGSMKMAIERASQRECCPILDEALRYYVNSAKKLRIFGEHVRWMEAKLAQSVGHNLWVLRKEDEKKSGRPRGVK